jgi:hypothetical protein
MGAEILTLFEYGRANHGRDREYVLLEALTGSRIIICVWTLRPSLGPPHESKKYGRPMNSPTPRRSPLKSIIVACNAISGVVYI